MLGEVVDMVLAKHRVIAMTDRAIVVLKASALTPATPKEVLLCAPRSTRLGPLDAKLWGEVVIDGERHWSTGASRPTSRLPTRPILARRGSAPGQRGLRTPGRDRGRPLR